ncbi:MAG: hypothetical protein MUF62_13585 [Chitinophagaceae bacterium]|nr:hypothetical protein [Chitinophagaceae bacterium]
MDIRLSFLYFEIQSAFMTDQQESLQALQDIRKMMDRSSRFLSLSGWSGVAAGCCALVGAWFAHGIIQQGVQNHSSLRKMAYQPAEYEVEGIPLAAYIGSDRLVIIALLTLAGALLTAFFFTWMRSRKTNTALWGPTSRRLSWALGLPLGVGGVYMLTLMQAGAFGLIAPGCLLFYGLGLVSASRYTLGEIRWLGYGQLATGLLNLLFTGYGLYFWAFGFGILHIVYGLIMWWKHERPSAAV